MNRTSLFRTAALEARRTPSLGDIVLIRPISFSVLAISAALIATALVAFLLVGSYTKRTTVRGHLAPDVGVLKIYAPQPGIVLEKNVHEGQLLKKGELLYLISSERHSSSAAGIQAEISQQVALRQQSLRDELRYTRQLQQEQENALRRKIQALTAEQANVAAQLAGQRIRVELAQAGVQRAGHLLTRGYMSADMTQQKQADLLDQQNRMQSLERDGISLERELQTLRSELATLPLQRRNQLAQIERLLTSTTQEWTESEGKRGIAITAPESGIGTALSAEVGQTVDSAKPLMSILPEGATLLVFLYAPSRAIGFVRTGDKVLLRYHAYPYQKFGHAHGVVSSISRTAIPAAELPADVGTGEPLYRINVTLLEQTVLAYGKAQTLQAGMLVDADILHEKRKLYEWALEPLFSLTGKL